MHFKAALSAATLALLAGSVSAVDMKYYKQVKGVSRNFYGFLDQFYTFAEATTPEASTSFQGFFATDAVIGFPNMPIWFGKSGAATFKVAITNGNQFNHYPRTPSVIANTATTQTLAIAGSAKETYPNGTCVSTEYVTHWEVLTKDGKPILGPNCDQIKFLTLISKAPSAGDCNSY